MFALPQHGAMPDSPEHPLSRPVIDVAEDSEVLAPLLRLCYSGSGQDASLEPLDSVLPVLEAAIKYDMERPITDALTARLLACTAQGPLQVWAFGCRHGLEHVARGGAEALRAALPPRARETLSFLPDIPLGLQVLDGISAGQYFRLLQFIRRRDCSAAVRRGCSPSAAGTGGAEGSALVRPAEIATAAVATPTLYRWKALDLLGHIPMDVCPPDIICRCQDGTEFEAHQHTLSLHSPVLKAQIATLNAALEVPQPSRHEGFAEQVEEPAAQHPVLQLEGPSHAASILLRICYEQHYCPQSSEPPHTHLDCIELLAIATKYEIRPTIYRSTARWEALAHIHPRNTGTPRAERAGAEAGAVPPMCLYQAVTDVLNRRREEVERREVAPKADLVRAIRRSSYRNAPGPPSLRKKFKADLDGLLASLPREIDDALNKVKLDLE